ncbi:hypothetical protein AAFC00_005162 [Neodothiora populina]|uniref:Uncharacterized protein n=1 Tax=Neodothiora populina TaxID=2781224 RepID=A0ABR3PJZ6_9PEZI
MDVRDWRKGAVRRLASIYEDITSATARNSSLLSDVSKALKDGAAAMGPSRLSSADSLPTHDQSGDTPSTDTDTKHERTVQDGVPSSPFTQDTISPQLSTTTSTLLANHPDSSQGLHKASSSKLSMKGKMPVLPTQAFQHSHSPLSSMMPPTPPDSPVAEGGAQHVFTSLPSLPPSPLQLSPPMYQTSFLHLETSKLTYSSLVQPSSVSSASTSPAFDQFRPQISPTKRSPDVAISLTEATAQPMILSTLPKIRLRDTDDGDAKSREVSLSSIASLSQPLPVHSRSAELILASPPPLSHPEKDLGAAGESVSDVDNDDEDQELDAYLAPMRAEALKSLEEDTATLVDALRSFVNSLGAVASLLKGGEKGSSSPDSARPASGNDPGRNGHLNQSRSYYEGKHSPTTSQARELKLLCATAREDMERVKDVIYGIKAPRTEMASLCADGSKKLLVAEGHTSERWQTLSRKAKIRLLYSTIKQRDHQHGRQRGRLSRTTMEAAEECLIAVLAEKANEEFLIKITEWEVGVSSLEHEFGSLLT